MTRDAKNQFVEVEVVAYAKVAPQRFTYSLPEDIRAQPGDICVVPFGRRQSLAVVRAISDTAPETKFAIRQITRKIELPRPLPADLLEFSSWLASYYQASATSVWTALLPSGLGAKSRLGTQKPSRAKKTALNPLNSDQKNVFAQLQQNPGQAWLLQGVTGSGKTEVYLHTIARSIAAGHSCIVLVPEIMLTTQLVERIRAHFENVFLTHSGLTTARRKAIWQQILGSDEPVIVVGSRSAILSPVPKLGLIIVDEEHEGSYKQDSGLHYDAVLAAGWRARRAKATLILGSATPSMRAHFLLEAGRLKLLELPTRHSGTLPRMRITSLPKQGLLGEELQAAITSTLAGGKQVLLLLNRRGSARALLCEDCGAAMRCQSCNISLVYHADENKLRCHYCNFATPPPAACPVCQSSNLRFVGSGTKTLISQLETLWPEARLARIDRDNADWEHLQTTYQAVQAGEVDILVGTQMISRGLDFSGIELVGIVDADTQLQIPDFTAAERTFSLIVQTAGRAGRGAGSQNGQVIIQTRNPTHPSIVAAAALDDAGFTERELATRAEYAYPPYIYLVKLWYGHKNNATAETEAKKFAEVLRRAKLNVLGPSKMLYSPRVGQHSWMIIIKTSQHHTAESVAAQLPAGWKAELDPNSIL